MDEAGPHTPIAKQTSFAYEEDVQSGVPFRQQNRVCVVHEPVFRRRARILLEARAGLGGDVEGSVLTETVVMGMKWQQNVVNLRMC